MTVPFRDLVVVDVGNTAAKVAWFRDDRIEARVVLAHSDAANGDRPAALGELLARTPGVPVAIASVRADACERLIERFPADRRVLRAPDDFVVLVENDCDPRDGVGLDRLFDAAAIAGDRLPAVVIDVGTAITVDRVDPPGIFRGGAIAPGVSLSFRALCRDTGRLPLVTPGDAPPAALGRDTAAALRAGVVRGLAGLVDRLATDLSGDDAATFWITGGEAHWLLPLLATRPRYDADLTLRGIARSARHVLSMGP